MLNLLYKFGPYLAGAGIVLTVGLGFSVYHAALLVITFCVSHLILKSLFN